MSTASKARKSYRGVAQFGRALRSGRRGRVFESRRFDLGKARELNVSGLLYFSNFHSDWYSDKNILIGCIYPKFVYTYPMG